MKSSLLVFLLHSTGALSIPLKTRDAPKRLVVFGDSFSDNGNGAWIVSNNTWPADPAYYEHSFSNGPVWNVLVAQNLGLELINYATGSATADNLFVAGFTGPNADIPVPAASDQIDRFLAEETVSPDDVFVHWIGANDPLFDIDIDGAQVTSIVAAHIDQLFRSGARHILLPTYFSLDQFPATYGVAEYASLGEYTTRYTGGLKNIVAAYSAYMDIKLVDVGSLIAEIVASPDSYGIDPAYLNPPTACLLAYGGADEPRSLCDDPDKHFFFDEYHPTGQVHARIAELFEKVLGNL